MSEDFTLTTNCGASVWRLSGAIQVIRTLPSWCEFVGGCAPHPSHWFTLFSDTSGALRTSIWVLSELCYMRLYVSVWIDKWGSQKNNLELCASPHRDWERGVVWFRFVRPPQILMSRILAPPWLSSVTPSRILLDPIISTSSPVRYYGIFGSKISMYLRLVHKPWLVPLILNICVSVCAHLCIHIFLSACPENIGLFCDRNSCFSCSCPTMTKFSNPMYPPRVWV